MPRACLALLAGTLLPAAPPDARWGRIPISFIPNHGQADGRARFLAKGSGLTAYFGAEDLWFQVRGTRLRLRFPGANSSPRVEPEGAMEGRANFLIGDDPAKWQTNLPMYERLIYREIYPAIDMVYGGHGRRLKADFVVAPGGDPSQIQIEYEGAQDVTVDAGGALRITVPEGELREEPPVLYQQIDGERVAVEGAFRILGPNRAGFATGRYDRSRPLIIDPVLSYSTYVGGSGTDRAQAIAVDATGNAYIAGYTDSTNFPVSSGVSGGGVDAFVTKLNSSGNAVVYSTYLGGSGDDRAFSIKVDPAGYAYISGWTGSTNFPIASPIQSANGGGRDAFVVKLNSTGSGLVWGTYLGGSGTESGNGIAIDAGANVYVTGVTTSTNFPLAGAYQAANRGLNDAFVAKINTAGTSLVYATYLGGTADDSGQSIAVDASGNAYVAGTTSSTDFPVVSPVQVVKGGGQDAFVAKLSSTGATLGYSTYLGGSGTEFVEAGSSVAVDTNGSAYITGTTQSTNYPTSSAWQATHKGGANDAFLTKLSAAGSAFVYSTFLGASSLDYGNAVAVDSNLNAYVAGYTASIDFPAVGSSGANSGSYDAYVVRFNASGSAQLEGGLLGGTLADSGFGMALGSNGYVYITGQTASTNLPLLNPAQSTSAGLEAFVARFSFQSAVAPSAVSVTPSAGSGGSQVFSFLYTQPLAYTGIQWTTMNIHTTLTSVGACYLQYDVATNTLQLANDSGSGWAGSITVGAPGTLANSQCSVDGALSSAVGAGTSLTVSPAITFQAAFNGAKNIYMAAMGGSGLFSGWQTGGTWTVSANGPPVTVSVTPSSGSGVSQTFSFAYSDPNGYADITWAAADIHTAVSSVGACYLQYSRATNSVQLAADDGSGWVGSATLGLPGTLTNSQCSVSGAGSSASGSGNNLTVNLAVTFRGTFGGAKNVYMSALDSASQFSGWLAMGTFSPNPPPRAVLVTPSTGAGASQTFSFLYSDAAGYADITRVNANINTTLSSTSSCYFEYTRATNTLVLASDSGGAWTGTVTVGAPGTLANSQCSVNAAASSASGSGNNLALNLAISFQPAYAGSTTVYGGAVDSLASFSGWQPLGTWTVNTTPSTISVNPSSGSGVSLTFSFVYRDLNGFTDITRTNASIGATLTSVNSCYLEYTRSTNTLVLSNDAGTGWVGTAVLGSAGVLVNSQCSIDAAASSAPGSGNDLTVNLAVTFRGAFGGLKSVYMAALDSAGNFGPWQAMGTWTANTPPGNVSVAPLSGAGPMQAFSFLYTDANGFADIARANVDINTTLSAVGGCYLEYTRATNTLVLASDSGATWVGSAVLGSPGALANSQCIVDAGASSAPGSGNNLTLILSLTFRSAFAGPKNMYQGALDTAGSFSGWQSLGTWTVNPPPAAVSVTPPSGAGLSQTFSLLYSDPNGFGDITRASAAIGPTLTSVASCYLEYSPATNKVVLANDSGGSWAGSAVLGVAGWLANSQCSINTGLSAASGAGNNLALSISVTFRTGFGGAMNIYGAALDSVGSFSGWLALGTFTANPPPAAVSVTPASGNSASQTFSFLFTDANGFADIFRANMAVNTTVSSAGGCYMEYTRATNSLVLANDAGSGWVGSGILGAAGTLQNSKCTVNLATSSASSAGNNLTVNVAIAFQAAFSGAKNLYAAALDTLSSFSGWLTVGTWTVP